jgi:ribosomal protein S18 acetylase RimI-like enzyme
VSELIIRPARDEDLPTIGELTYQAYYHDGYVASRDQGGYGLTLSDARPRYEQAEVLVAVDDTDTILGTVTIAQPGSNFSEIATSGEVEFRMLAVSPAARGRGTGEALTRHVIEQATERGLTAVVLSSSPTMHTAHRLYERLGFYRTPDLDWFPGPGIPLITYRLDL